MSNSGGEWEAFPLIEGTCSSAHDDIIQRILEQAYHYPWIFWEVWAFIPKRDVFYVFQKTHYQKCKLTKNESSLRKDPHFLIMNQPVLSRIIPWCALPSRYTPKGLNGMSIFLQNSQDSIGYAKLGIEKYGDESSLLCDELFLTYLTEYKKALEEDLHLLKESYL